MKKIKAIVSLVVVIVCMSLYQLSASNFIYAKEKILFDVENEKTIETVETIIEAENTYLIPDYIEAGDPKLNFIKEAGGEAYYSNGFLIKTQTTSAAITLTFEGTGIEFITKKGPGAGIIGIEIYEGSDLNGECILSEKIDLYNQVAAFKQTVFSKRGLVRGQYTIKLNTLNEKNPNSTGFNYNFDFFKVIDRIDSELVQSPGQTTYYLDSNAIGNGDGLTPNTPWNSLESVNKMIFAQGDQILIKADSVFVGQLYPKGSGSLENPIRIDKYGEGEKPLIDGSGRYGIAPKYGENGPFGKEGSAVYLYNSEYWEISNLRIRNWDSVDSDKERSGIRVEASGGGVYRHIYILNCDIYDVRGYTGQDSIWNEGSFYGARTTHRTGGINFCTYTNRDPNNEKVIIDENPTIFDDILIEGNTINNCDANGITLTNVKGPLDDRDYRHTNVIIRNNYIHDVERSGIIPLYTNGVLVEYNKIDTFQQTRAGYGCGIWNDRGNDMTYQYNEVCNGQNTYDGMAFNFDDMTENGVIQYNYTHNNVGGGIMLHVRSGSYNRNNTVRYNLSVNDTHSWNAHQAIIVAVGENNTTKIENARVYNNTFINNNDIYPVYNGNEVIYTNNIFHLTHPNTANRSMAYSTVGPKTQFINNVFSGVHAKDEPKSNGNKSINNVKFLGALLGEEDKSIALEAARLFIDSEALKAGRIIENNCKEDLYGNEISKVNPPNVGAYNGLGIRENYVYVSLIGTQGGTVLGNGVIERGSEITITAIPTAGYRFKGWYKDNILLSKQIEYTFTAQDDIEIIAYFESVEEDTIRTIVEAEKAQLDPKLGTDINVEFAYDLDTSSHGEKHIRTYREGATVSLEFEGTGIYFYTKKGPMAGKLGVTIDGKTYEDIDLYSSISDFQALAFSVTELENTNHKVVLTTRDAGSRNPNCTTSKPAYNFDYFEIVLPVNK